MRSVPDIAFDYRPSRALAGAAIAVALLAVLAASVNALPALARIAIAAVAIVWGLVSLGRFLDPPFRRIAWRSSGWSGVDRAGEERTLALVSHARIGPWLALDFGAPGERRFRAVLGPGNLDAQTRRRLAVLLTRAEIAHAE